MYVQRTLKKQIQEKLFAGKLILLYGPRRVGKTTLCKEILKEYGSGKYFLCDEPDVRAALTNKTSTELRNFLGNEKLIIIDEAQRVENIGLTLKLLVDNYPETQIIATGSSSFDLANKVNEPLTGRNFEFHLFPFSLEEIKDSIGELELKRNLPKILNYGLYPEIFLSSDPEELILKMSQDQLYKDVLMYQNIRKPQVLDALLGYLALSVGQELSYSKIATQLEVSKETIMWYLRLLEQAYLIYRLGPISRNKKKEITRFNKYYFFDTGIRNALINSFKDNFESRTDFGHLWENFVVAEKIKRSFNQKMNNRYYFWRTKDGSEIDLVEEQKNRNISALEIKYSKNNANSGKAFLQEFPGSDLQIVNKENYLDFLS